LQRRSEVRLLETNMLSEIPAAVVLLVALLK
jgi:hypothetical protein